MTLWPYDLAGDVDRAVAVEAAALGRSEEQRRDSYLAHAGYPGYHSWAALDGDELVGLAYGHRSLPGQWWHDTVTPAMEAAGHGDWLDDVFCLVELHVLPSHQGRGLGVGLLRALLTETDLPRVLLSTADAATRARALYHHLGFVDLVTGFWFPTAGQPFAVMGARLPLREPSR